MERTETVSEMVQFLRDCATWYTPGSSHYKKFINIADRLESLEQQRDDFVQRLIAEKDSPQYEQSPQVRLGLALAITIVAELEVPE